MLHFEKSEIKKGVPPRMRVDAPSLELLSGKNSRPSIEKLNRIDTGSELANEVARGSIDKKLDQLSRFQA